MSPLARDLDAAIQQSIDQKTKPVGALGRLEEIAAQVARIQHSLSPTLDTAVHLVFAGDHGVHEEGISPYPQTVTQQMVLNFLQGGAAISVFCRHHDVLLKVVDAGVKGDLPRHPDLVQASVRTGSANFAIEPAMEWAEVEQCLHQGARVVDQFAAKAQVVSLGEMGIGNSTAAAALLCALFSLAPEQVVGAGTGADPAMQARKADTVARALALHGLSHSRPLEIMRAVGGLELAMMTGAYLRAAALGKLILVDGFIATSAWAIANALQPALRDYSLFCHVSSEKGHALILQRLRAEPLLQLQMRLGEGTGAVAALPLVRLAVAFFNEMASFDDAGVSQAR